MSKTPLDIVCIDKTKFNMENYQFSPFRRDRNSKVGGKLVFVEMALLLKESKVWKKNVLNF